MTEDEVANMLYVAVVNPDLTWWDDLTPEMQEGWRRAARKVLALPPDSKRLTEALRRAFLHQPWPWRGDGPDFDRDLAAAAVCQWPSDD